MPQLSAHDATFLYSDTTHSNANVTLIHIYNQSTAPGGRVRFKTILNTGDGEIFDLAADPGEAIDAIGEHAGDRRQKEHRKLLGGCDQAEQKR